MRKNAEENRGRERRERETVKPKPNWPIRLNIPKDARHPTIEFDRVVESNRRGTPPFDD